MGRRGGVVGACAVAVAMLAVGCQPATPPSPPPGPPAATPVLSTEDRSTTFQVNAGHDGRIAASPLRPPLVERWSRDFPTPGTGNALSAPVVADGRVFFTGFIYLTTALVYGVDQATGDLLWDPIRIGGGGHRASVAYDGGRLFAGNADGELFAFDPATGRQLWHSRAGGSHTAITASDGLVFAGPVTAVRQSDGALVWRRQDRGGGQSAPTVGGGSVFLSHAGPQVRSLSLQGVERWRYDDGFGGGGSTSVLHDGRLYVREHSRSTPPTVFDARTGARLGTFESEHPPAFHGSTRFDTGLSPGGCCAVRAVDDRTNRLLWSFSGPGELTAGPIVVGDTVYVAAGSGEVYGLDVRTGQVQWTANAGDQIDAPDEQNGGGPLVGLAAGGGMLLVPAGSRMVAYAPAAPAPSPSAQEIELPATELGRRSEAAVRITNQGRQRLDLGAARLTGDGAGGFEIVGDGCSQASLVTAQRCVVRVRFAPDRSGRAPAELVVPGNAPTGPTRVSLSGTGVAPDAHLDRYLDRVYRVVLGRAPDAAGRAYWRAYLATGETRRALVRALVSSDEYRRRVVRAEHLDFLYRKATSDELAAGAEALRTGASPRDLAVAIMMTAEAWRLLPDERLEREESLPGAFLWRLFLSATEDNPPATRELNLMVVAVGNPATKADVVAAVVNRPDALRVRVRRHFLAILGRAPTPAEADRWFARFRSGSPEADLVVSLAASRELFDRT